MMMLAVSCHHFHWCTVEIIQRCRRLITQAN